MTSDFSSENMQVRRKWREIFVLREKTAHLEFCTQKSSFIGKKEIKFFSDKKKKNEGIYSSRRALREMVKEILQ